MYDFSGDRKSNATVSMTEQIFTYCAYHDIMYNEQAVLCILHKYLLCINSGLCYV